MKLYIKQRIWSVRDKFNIYNDKGEPCFEVKSSYFAIPKRFYLSDMQGNVHLEIRHKFFDFLPKYYMFRGNDEIALVKSRFSFNASFDIESRYGTYSVEGDIFAWNYQIIKNGDVIASVRKDVLSIFRDSYEIEVYDDSDILFCLGLAIIFDENHHGNNDN